MPRTASKRRGVNALSLEWGAPVFWTTALNLFVAGLFLLFYLIPVALPWLPLAFSILYTLHVSAVWIYLMYELFAEETLIISLSGFRILVLYLATMLQYAFWHAVALAFNPGAFVGIPEDASQIRRFLFSLFVSAETIGSLGSGAIIARSDGAFVTVGFNTVHGLLLLAVAFPMLITLVLQKQSKRGPSQKVGVKRTV